MYWAVRRSCPPNIIIKEFDRMDAVIELADGRHLGYAEYGRLAENHRAPTLPSPDEDARRGSRV
jgi:hypothetical protein